MKKILLYIFIAARVFSQENISISGTVDWETMQVSSATTLDLVSAGLRLPAGRNQAESILQDNYRRLIRTAILELQVDSSSTVADYINRGDISLSAVDSIMYVPQPAALSNDMRKITANYLMPMNSISSLFHFHTTPSPVTRSINPATTANYTGIIIIASETLPAHGTRRSYMPVPCLFPKIWDSEMNLIYNRNMINPGTSMVHYSSNSNILFNSPSGLSPELERIAGERPLRIFARGVFGVKPTDLIIDREDALQIISNEANRNLLTQGKVVIILNDSVLKSDF